MLVVLRVHVAAGEAPVVRGLEVQRGAGPRGAAGCSGSWLVKLMPLVRREVRVGVDARGRCRPGLVEAALGDAAQHAAVLEAAARVGGGAGQARLVVTDVGERVAVVVDALREVAAPLEGGGDAALPLGRGVLVRRWNSWLQKKKSFFLSALNVPGM